MKAARRVNRPTATKAPPISSKKPAIQNSEREQFAPTVTKKGAAGRVVQPWGMLAKYSAYGKCRIFIVPNSRSRTPAIRRRRLRKCGAKARQNENPLAMDTSGDERGGSAASGDRRLCRGTGRLGDRFHCGTGLHGRMRSGGPPQRAVSTTCSMAS